MAHAPSSTPSTSRSEKHDSGFMEWFTNPTESIKQHPYTALCVGFGLGMLLSRFLRR